MLLCGKVRIVKAVMSQPVFSDWRQHARLARTTQPQRGRMRLKGLQSEVKTKTRGVGGQIGMEMMARERCGRVEKGGMLQGGSEGVCS